MRASNTSDFVLRLGAHTVALKLGAPRAVGLGAAALIAAACSSGAVSSNDRSSGQGGASAPGGASSSGGAHAGTTSSGGAATAGTSNPNAGATSGGSAGASSGGSNPNAGTGSGGSNAGTGSGGSNAGAAGGNASGGAAAGGANAGDPNLPAIVGTCPNFTTGTATISGLGGIALQAGPKHDRTGSLLFYWHGTGSTAGEVNLLLPAAVRQEILSQGGIIVSFQDSLKTGGDCSGTNTFSKDDFQIADLIAACAVRDYGIDPRRIYTTGCSAGGLQAGCMGALRSSYIAAVVPNSGGEVAKLPIQDPSRVPAVMTLHGGTTDQVVVSFATTSAAYDAQMKSAGSFVVNCNHDGGHCQAPAALYSASWEFMKAHPFGVEPEPYASALPATFPSYCAAF